MESFDPVAEWLGRPPGPPPEDHYELLGLPRFEPDIDLIVHTVDLLRVQIRKVRPGKHVGEWQRLLDRLEAAKRCLSDPVSKAAYDESIDTASHTLNVSSSPDVTLDLPNQEMMAPAPEDQYPNTSEAGFVEPPASQSSEFVEVPPVIGQTQSTTPTPETSADAPFPVVRRARRKSSGAWRSVRLLLVTLLLLILAIGLVVLKKQKDARQAALAPPSRGAERHVIEAPNQPTTERPTPMPPPVEKPSRPAPAPTPTPTPAPAAPVPPPTPPTAQQPASPMSVPGMAPSQPAAPSPAPPSKPSVDPARQRAFRQALDSVRKAMAERDLEAAATRLNNAVSLTQTDEERTEANEVEVLLAHVERFWESLRDLSPRSAGDEIMVGETPVFVVEAGRESVTFRAGGKQKTYSFREMRYELVVAMAQSLFSKSPNAKALRASFVITDPKGDAQMARQLLNEASQGGAEVDELLSELNRSR